MRRNQSVSFGRDVITGLRLTGIAAGCRVTKTYGDQSLGYGYGRNDDADYGDMLALSPWPLFFTNVKTAKIVA